jgi:hypothetical protein
MLIKEVTKSITVDRIELEWWKRIHVAVPG